MLPCAFLNLLAVVQIFALYLFQMCLRYNMEQEEMLASETTCLVEEYIVSNKDC